MGISMTLLPMFSLAHGFDETPIKIGFNLVTIGVGVVFIGSLVEMNLIQWLGYAITLLGVIFYNYQVYLIYKLVVRKEMDIWAKSMIFGFGSLILSVIIGIVYLFGADVNWLHLSIWLFVVGFIGFLINGHLYKIVPFLVWFERYSPLVGKEKVPMLHEMYPKSYATRCFYLVL